MKKTVIIAEAGVNHNGSYELAKKLVDIASKSGSDYVKFQTFKSELVFSKNTPKADYQKKNTSKNISALQMGQKLELNEMTHLKLMKYCKKKRIGYLTTFHDIESLKKYKNFKLDYIKIGSGDITNLPYLKEISRMNKKIILSTGLSYLKEIKKALKILTSNKLTKKDIIVLHCNSAYPTPLSDVNLNVLSTIKKLGVDVGYSDHTLGIEVSLAAVSMGAKIIEKHFTIDKKMNGPDHEASLEPNELYEMVRLIRNIDLAKGISEKKPTKSELKNRKMVRKSIVAFKKIKKGEKFTKNNLFIKRPSDGISPMKYFQIIGRKAKKNYKIDEMIK